MLTTFPGPDVALADSVMTSCARLVSLLLMVGVKHLCRHTSCHNSNEVPTLHWPFSLTISLCVS